MQGGEANRRMPPSWSAGVVGTGRWKGESGNRVIGGSASATRVVVSTVLWAWVAMGVGEGHGTCDAG